MILKMNTSGLNSNSGAIISGLPKLEFYLSPSFYHQYSTMISNVYMTIIVDISLSRSKFNLQLTQPVCSLD